MRLEFVVLGIAAVILVIGTAYRYHSKESSVFPDHTTPITVIETEKVINFEDKDFVAKVVRYMEYDHPKLDYLFSGKTLKVEGNFKGIEVHRAIGKATLMVDLIVEEIGPIRIQADISPEEAYRFNLAKVPVGAVVSPKINVNHTKVIFSGPKETLIIYGDYLGEE